MLKQLGKVSAKEGIKKTSVALGRKGVGVLVGEGNFLSERTERWIVELSRRSRAMHQGSIPIRIRALPVRLQNIL